jgi:hypothetical protein
MFSRKTHTQTKAIKSWTGVRWVKDIQLRRKVHSMVEQKNNNQTLKNFVMAPEGGKSSEFFRAFY